MSKHDGPPSQRDGELPEVAPAYDFRTGQPLSREQEDLGMWAPGRSEPTFVEQRHAEGQPPPAGWDWRSPTPQAPASALEPAASNRRRYAIVGLVVLVAVLAIGIGVGVLAAGRGGGHPRSAAPSAVQTARTEPSPGSPPTAATVTADRQVIPGHFLNKRAQPDPSLPTLGQVFGGESVVISCQLLGPDVTDPSGGVTNVWDRLQDGTYITDLWVDTTKSATLGFDPGIPVCR